MTTEDRKQIADEILNQLGGRHFIVMTGAKNFSFDETGALGFQMPIGEWRYCKIVLTPMDVYTVTFTAKRGQRGRDRSSYATEVHDGIYAEDLRRIFEKATGLRTSLGIAR